MNCSVLEGAAARPGVGGSKQALIPILRRSVMAGPASGNQGRDEQPLEIRSGARARVRLVTNVRSRDLDQTRQMRRCDAVIGERAADAKARAQMVRDVLRSLGQPKAEAATA